MINRLAAMYLAGLFYLAFVDIAFAVPEHTSRPGGLTVISVTHENLISPPIVVFDDKRVLIICTLVPTLTVQPLIQHCVLIR